MSLYMIPNGGSVAMDSGVAVGVGRSRTHGWARAEEAGAGGSEY
jgi:hypothetical protein